MFVMFVAIRLIVQMFTLSLRRRLKLALQISQGSASTYLRWSGHFRSALLRAYFGTIVPILLKTVHIWQTRSKI